MGAELPGFASVTAGFEVPLEMLAACRGRIRERCSTLLRLRAHVEQQGADTAASHAARSVIRYFDTSARHHHEDGEQDLFPALLSSAPGPEPVCIRQLIEPLAEEHRQLERLWGAVRKWLVAVEALEAASPRPAEIDSLVGLYERHTAREEAELLPMAVRLLGTPELDRIGRAMRMRRGVTAV